MKLIDPTTIEVELKFPVDDLSSLKNLLLSLGAVIEPTERHQDTYLRHPCRDFAQTREALRIRRVITESAFDDRRETFVTYKGPHMPGGIKARQEMEWSIEPADPDGTQLQSLFMQLGFEPVATVEKHRQSLRLQRGNRVLTVTLDDVFDVGTYAEVEVIAIGKDDVAVARNLVESLAAELGLKTSESRSYLSLLLSKRNH